MTESPQRKSPMPLVLGLAVALVCAPGRGLGLGPPVRQRRRGWREAVDDGLGTGRRHGDPDRGRHPGLPGRDPHPGATSLGSAVLVHEAPAGAAAVTLFVDPQCPICAKFESIFGKGDQRPGRQGDHLGVVPRDVLPRPQPQERLTRPAVPTRCSALPTRGRCASTSQALMAGQPAQEGDGFTDAALTQFATTAGITGDALATFSSCLTGRTYAAQVAASEASAEAAGFGARQRSWSTER